MISNFIILKTVIPKAGDVKSYIDKPFLDRVSETDPFKSKVIGVIRDAVEIEEGYELTIALFAKYNFEFFDNMEFSAMSIELRAPNNDKDLKLIRRNQIEQWGSTETDRHCERNE